MRSTRQSLLLVLLSAGMVLSPAAWADQWDSSPHLAPTLIYRPGPAEGMAAPSKAIQTPALGQTLAAQVSLFYPTKGQSQGGACWQGLMIDSSDNVYPLGNGQIYKILPDGTLVNGVADQNFFASNGGGYGAVLDESDGSFYSLYSGAVAVAPFAEGSTFSVLISGFGNGHGLALGRGPLAGSLFVTERGGRVDRITLAPLGWSVFASGPLFNVLEGIASAPDGTLYTVNLHPYPATLTRITPTGVASFFAAVIDPATRAVTVDQAGNVYWSQSHGINKYDPSGRLLGTLPGPPNKPVYENPMSAAFDSKGNLYVLDNFGCKEIYKLTLMMTVNLDIKPGGFPNAVNPRSRGVIPVAILTTSTFDATTVEPLSVRFGPRGAMEAHGQGHIEDIDGDGDLDFVLHFQTQDTGILCGETSASLTGQTSGGQTIGGSDSLSTVGCK